MIPALGGDEQRGKGGARSHALRKVRAEETGAVEEERNCE